MSITGEATLSLKLAEEIEEIKSVTQLAESAKKALDKPTANLVQIVFGGSIRLNASDIHFETEKEQAKLRIRIDGILHDVCLFPLKTYYSLLSRIKLLSGLKLNISDRPQDGRFTVAIEGQSATIEIRTSIIPTEYGESIVARILNPQNLISLEELGLREDLLSLFKTEIAKPNGMIIVTGPTGSGKTTTLYAFLKTIQNPEIKIITIEDPIEYHLYGIEQTQISKNYDFANGLKSIVRQDPDVILVGEIRDAETADIALQAALTGHLVFTTLHTNDAAGTIARLIALGAKAHNMGPAINMAVAQRLVRKTCQACVKYAPISTTQIQKLKDELKNLPKHVKIPELKPDLKIPKVQGCGVCDQTGYKGRIGIFEAMLINSIMERFIVDNPSISQIRDLAMQNGMVTMRQDGFIKTLQGATTIEEIERVTAEKK